MEALSRRDDGAARRVLSEAVAEHLEARILDGTFRPGDRLPPERELAGTLKVNRSSVREALKRLEQLRLVEIHQGSGIRVRRLDEASFELLNRLLERDGRPDLGWIREMLELRGLLLVGLVKLSLERGSAEEQRRLIELLEHATRPDPPDSDFLDTVMRIQDLAARMTHNRAAVLLWNSLRRPLVQRSLQEAHRNIARHRRELAPGFQRFAEAVRARSHEEAVQCVSELLARFEQAILAGASPDAAAHPVADRRGG